jgi:nitrate/nitrite-specific signal transduction histidine kinase
MAIFFLAALASIAYFSRKLLLNPIEAIVAGTHEVGAGNLQARIRVRTEDELGDLARSFNAMTGQLAQAQQNLEGRVEERTRELRALLDVSNVMSSTLDLDRLLGVVLDQLKVAADYTAAAVLVVEGEDLVTRESRGPGGPVPREALVDQRFRVANLGPIWDAMARGTRSSSTTRMGTAREPNPSARPRGGSTTPASPECVRSSRCR